MGNESLVLWRDMEVFGLGFVGELFGDMARAGTGEFIGIDEESSVGVAGIYGESSMVDILLGTLGLVARSEKTA